MLWRAIVVLTIPLWWMPFELWVIFGGALRELSSMVYRYIRYGEQP